MSIAEVVRRMRKGELVVLRISLWNDGVRRMYVGTPDKVPDTYDVEILDESRIIVRFGGSKRVMKRRKDAWITVPASVAKGKEGPVLAEWLDDRTLLVYLG